MEKTVNSDSTVFADAMQKLGWKYSVEDITLDSYEQVDFIQNWINNFPRKIFNCHSSDFLFKNVLFDIAI